eukprot:9998062-Prorocentrum_lima.AAC.1
MVTNLLRRPVRPSGRTALHGGKHMQQAGIWSRAPEQLEEGDLWHGREQLEFLPVTRRGGR